MRSAVAIALALAVLCVVAGCTSQEDAPKGTVADFGHAQKEALPEKGSAQLAWSVSLPMQTFWTGGVTPWAWEHSDDVVVIARGSLVALDLETGLEEWRLGLPAGVCGSTPRPSEAGLVGVVVGEGCPVGSGRRQFGGPYMDMPVVPRPPPNTLMVVDLKSGSVVWQRKHRGESTIDIGGEVLLTVDGCRLHRWQLSDGAALADVRTRCSDDYGYINDEFVAGHGVVVISRSGSRGPRRLQVVDVSSGGVTVDALAEGIGTPRRILAAEPKLVLTAGGPGDFAVGLIDADGARVLTSVPDPPAAPLMFAQLARDAFLSPQDGSLAIVGGTPPRLMEMSLVDGSPPREVPVDDDVGVPYLARIGDGLLGVGSEGDNLNAGHGRLTLTSLEDGSVTVLERDPFRGDTNLLLALPVAMVIGDTLLMPKQDSGVLAYQFDLL